MKHQRPIGADQLNLTKLLVAKENELRETLKLADEQAKINEKMNLLKNEVDRQDKYIKDFERQLKDAEQILVRVIFSNFSWIIPWFTDIRCYSQATANFQAKQKLISIRKANKRPVSSEELIKYAHRISSSEAICAPLSWQAGDTRRPYPTGNNFTILSSPVFFSRIHTIPVCRFGHATRTPISIQRSAY